MVPGGIAKVTGADVTADPPTEVASRRLRGRNIALALALIAWVVLIYVISVVRMGGN
jgi:hypothetical protein